MFEIKSLFPYYGSKRSLIKDIEEELKESNGKIDTFVDVFGGSGAVSLNIPEKINAKKIIYNDKDKRLADTMVAIGDPDLRDSAIDMLKKMPLSKKKFEQVRDDEGFLNYPDENAANILYLSSTSFNNAMSSYRNDTKKSSQLINSTINHIKDNGKNVEKWKVANSDFRDIIPEYDSSKTLLYLDPPYLKGGKVYNNSFTYNDLKDLKEQLDDSNSNYMLSESEADIPEVKELFGKPSKIMPHKAFTHGKSWQKNEAIWKSFDF
jgi:DNA adenine methylase